VRVELPTLGSVEGYGTDDADYFLGIPYAKPPVADLRFRPAQPPKPWFPDVLDATGYKANCLQSKTFWVSANSSSEDCLYLNIITPIGHSQAKSEDKLAPVLIYIHGGGFVHGSGSVWNMTRYAKEHGLVTATLNYRLGALGHLALREFEKEDPQFPSNGGMNFLHDQIMALKFLKANIKYFGGNPDNITVFGESAGGISVCMLLFSPHARGLFEKAGIQSGPCIGPWGPSPPKVGLAAGKLFLDSLNVTNAAELRALSEMDLMNSQYFEKLPVTVDGYFLPLAPRISLSRGNHLPALPPDSQLLIGSNTNDGLAPYPWLSFKYPKTGEELKDLFSMYFGRSKLHSKVLEAYSPGQFEDNATLAFLQANADACVVCPIRSLARQVSLRPPGIEVSLYKYGFSPVFNGFSPHGSELPMVFGWDTSSFTSMYGFNETKSKMMRNWWGKFASSSWPWPSVGDGDQMKFLNISDHDTMLEGYRSRCDIWNDSKKRVRKLQCDFCFQSVNAKVGKVKFCIGH